MIRIKLETREKLNYPSQEMIKLPSVTFLIEADNGLRPKCGGGGGGWAPGDKLPGILVRVIKKRGSSPIYGPWEKKPDAKTRKSRRKVAIFRKTRKN